MIIEGTLNKLGSLNKFSKLVIIDPPYTKSSPTLCQYINIDISIDQYIYISIYLYLYLYLFLYVGPTRWVRNAENYWAKA